ncbi:major facilitator superfamily domain-containing protein [Pyronema domesticum]|uniref:Similar to Major facilitator superfamily domain-containing protein 10 acc. no. Q0P5M9 n=1 Tax=Pyronema omphalodes (strain CBS 100304) TaxID=1076935 RepID=U4KWX7_PYROM|nr:major facilitator superfamily domain-containing protein [Pyronema domesticum]CCX06467.1 Similar to Major facilitator superfamily domain-containing protein 10; acc. no. Q0P5M9 [Pyronema omphalodes CBS 100304]
MATSATVQDATKISPAYRKSILRVLFISLLLDLLSFTLILPLFPRLLDHYRSQPSNTLLEAIFTYLNTFKSAFHRPISSRFDVVLLGGALGSLFSILQAIASPIIGALSDRYGRRTALLYSMAGNILSVALWVSASTFPIFLASRVVGGLSEGNVQLAIAIATDVSTPETRGHTLALVGVAFSVAFTLGPMMGAWLSSKTLSLENPFMTAAIFSLVLLVTETLYLYFKLPETRVVRTSDEKKSAAKVDSRGLGLLKWTHFLFLLIFSGMEFSLPFMTFDLFNYSSAQNGRVLGFIGLLASLLQGGFSRRAKPGFVAKLGLCSSAMSFFLLAKTNSQGMLYLSAAFLAVTSACVVTALNTLASLRVGEENRGRGMGEFRSAGQIGRAIGPVLFCSLYWWAGRDVAYLVGGTGMALVTGMAWRGLVEPVKVEEEKKTL